MFDTHVGTELAVLMMNGDRIVDIERDGETVSIHLVNVFTGKTGTFVAGSRDKYSAIPMKIVAIPMPKLS